MRKQTSQMLGNVIVAAIGIIAIFGSLLLAQQLTGQSAVAALEWLNQTTWGLAGVGFAIVAAAVIIILISLRKKE